MLIEFRTADGTLLDGAGLDWGALEAGEASAPLVLDLSYRWGETGDGDKLTDLFLRLPVEDPQRAGVGVAKGVPPADQLWFRARFVGHDPTADPTQEPYLTDWLPLGAYRAIPFPSLHAGCSRRVEIIGDVPGAAVGAYTLLPTADYSEHARALAAPVPAGIERGLGDRSRSGLVRGGELTVSDPADDQVHIAAHQVLDRGDLHGHESASLALDRTDGDGTALADGDVYHARAVATSAGAAWRKGLTAADPQTPTREPGDLASLGVVRIEAPPGGGPPVITAADLLEGPRYDRHALESDGLNLYVHAGDAYGGGTWRVWQRRSDPLPLTASAVQWLWQLRTGAYELTPDETPPPEATALGPWAEIETDANGVIELVDRRTYNRPPTLLTATVELAGATGRVASWLLPAELHLEQLWIAIDAAPASAFGFDLLFDGGSLLVPGTEPTFDVAGALEHRDAIAVDSRLRAGWLLELHVTGTPPASGLAAVTLELVA